MIRKATSKDAKKIAKIYNHYITNTIATFAEEPISLTEMENTIKNSLLFI